MKLTDTIIKEAQIKTKPYKLADGKGLNLLVQPYGSKYWRFRYRVNGKEQVASFGVYPEVSIEEARKRTLDFRRLLRDKKQGAKNER